MSTALLVIDMQHFFAEMTTTALPNILKLASHFRSQKLPIILTQHGHSKEELKGPPFKNQLVAKWGPSGSIATGSEDWKLMPDIASIAESTSEAGTDTQVVAKNTYDAFINTDMESILRGKGVSRVVVCGVMTDCCCDTTARSAFNRGFETWLVRDACGSANKTQHEAGLKGFGFAFGKVITTRDAIKSLS